jgi:hypothetical protein
MTDKQMVKVRKNAYKYYDEIVFEHDDWSKRDITLSSFHAGAEYVLKNKHELRKDTVNSLAEFLVMEDALNAFIDNVLKQRGHDHLLYILECGSIRSAFDWEKTLQGYNYWCELSREYIELLEK